MLLTQVLHRGATAAIPTRGAAKGTPRPPPVSPELPWADLSPQTPLLPAVLAQLPALLPLSLRSNRGGGPGGMGTLARFAG